MTKPSPTCWLYLNCEDMTGKPAAKCPNRRKCRINAKHSDNLSCDLPYTYQQYDPVYDRLFDIKENHLLVHAPLEEEAKEAGWCPAKPLFYSYQNNALWIGIDPDTRYFRLMPKEAESLGFARAESTPYSLNSEPGKLHVTRYVPWCTYPKKFLDAGWSPSLELPYYIQAEDIGKEGDDYPIFKGLYVAFGINQPEYEEAIAAGWHSPVPLPQYDIDPDEGFDDDNEDNWTEDVW